MDKLKASIIIDGVQYPCTLKQSTNYKKCVFEAKGRRWKEGFPKDASVSYFREDGKTKIVELKLQDDGKERLFAEKFHVTKTGENRIFYACVTKRVSKYNQQEIYNWTISCNTNPSNKK